MTTPDRVAPAGVYDAADDIAAIRPRRRLERAIGVIDGPAIRYSDGLWVYRVLLESSGRVLRRVRDSVPTAYQTGAGLRQLGDRVSVIRVSRTVWEIAGDEPTPTSWNLTGSPDTPSVEYLTHRRLPSSSDPDDMPRVAGSRMRIYNDSFGFARGVLQASSPDGTAEDPVHQSAGAHMITTEVPGQGQLRLYTGDTLFGFDGAPECVIELRGFGWGFGDSGIRLRATLPDGEERTIAMDADGIVINLADERTITMDADGVDVRIQRADGVERALVLDADGVDIVANDSGNTLRAVATDAHGRLWTASNGGQPAARVYHSPARGISARTGGGGNPSHTHTVSISGSDVANAITSWLRRSDLPLHLVGDVSIQTTQAG